MSPEKESPLDFTESEFMLWLHYFRLGQNIFDTHVDNFGPTTPLHVCESYNNKKNIIAYVEELDQVMVTFGFIQRYVQLIRKSTKTFSTKSTNGHLMRLGMYTNSNLIPIFTGMEERAHSHYHKSIKPKLDPEKVVYTAKHDGTDSSEEYFFNMLIQIILNNKNLELYPLPKNFQNPYQNS